MIKPTIREDAFNYDRGFPFGLRILDFVASIQDVYDFLFDVNTALRNRGMQRLEDIMRPAAISGMFSDMLTASLARHSRTLVENGYFNGHPDLVVQGQFPDDKIQSGPMDFGVEVKSTRKSGGGVDMHGAREQWLAVFVYSTDNTTQPAIDRKPTEFTEIYLQHVSVADFRKNNRGELGTRTASLDAKGLIKLREGWVYKTV